MAEQDEAQQDEALVAEVLRAVAVDDGAAKAVFSPGLFLGLPDVTAHAWAGVVGVGRLLAGPPSSTRRKVAAAEVAAAVLRRVARRAGHGNRLRTEREPGPADDEVCVRWPAPDPAGARALAREVALLVGGMGGEPDEGRYLADVRVAGDRVAAQSP